MIQRPTDKLLSPIESPVTPLVPDSTVVGVQPRSVEQATSEATTQVLSRVGSGLSHAVSRRRLLTGLALGPIALLAASALSSRAQAAAGHAIKVPGFDEGIDFLTVGQPSQAAIDGDRIEVVEVFWYGCPHCNAFQPTVGPWIDSLDDDVAFRHLPAPFNPMWALHARAYYAAKNLGIESEFHSAFFAAIHDQQRNLNNASAIARFATVFGVTREDFQTAMTTEAVDAQIEADLANLRVWRVDGVPSLVVDGRFLIGAGMAGSHARMIEIADALISAVRQQRSAS
ncbi:MAG: thiol:disulfide interchange protein DsbA/DsbL [Thioalkalivibrionaceae bacterium]